MPTTPSALKKQLVDEEAFAESIPSSQRLERGAFFTPAAVVEQLIELAAPVVAERRGPLHVIDPACGAGAFLSAARVRWPRAQLLGVDVDEASIRICRERVPSAVVRRGDALAESTVDELLSDRPGVHLWLGNPPYNGTSELLKSKTAWERAQGWLPEGVPLPRGTSLRDDYVFFLLKASSMLERRSGVLAFVTSSTLLDAFQHAPIRQALLSRLALRHVVDLGAGAFRGTRVRTCLTVWSTWPTKKPARFNRTEALSPAAPDYSLRPVAPEAEALDARWRARGEPLTTLVPISFPGLKTRFDELLVDDDAERLVARLRDFSTARSISTFARRHDISERLWPKLEALHGLLRKVEPAKLRRFIRYRGPRGVASLGWCYLDRALIPRGDHRLQGDYDPHAENVKLVFNTHELPLAAHVVDISGCVTAYRHSRFAPLWVPQRVLKNGGAIARTSSDVGPLVPNLSPVGLRWAKHLGSPRAVFDAIARFVMSAPVHTTWAPAFGTRRTLPIPIRPESP